jgi:chorismate--pyruvate lyase
MINTQEIVWLSHDESQNIPEVVKIWLYDEQSLTKKLKCKFELFSVNIVSQKKITPCLSESKILNFSGTCVERIVELMGNNNAVVYARSVIPVTENTKKLLNIGSTPLGEVLFKNPDIVRESFQITSIEGTWGRRSIFTIGGIKILVSEFFLDALFL